MDLDLLECLWLSVIGEQKSIISYIGQTCFSDEFLKEMFGLNIKLVVLKICVGGKLLYIYSCSASTTVCRVQWLSSRVLNWEIKMKLDHATPEILCRVLKPDTLSTAK